MNKALITSIVASAMLFADTSDGQISTSISNIRTLNTDWYTSATPLAPLQLWQEQDMHDSILWVELQLLDTIRAIEISSCSCTLQAVLNNGNTASSSGGGTDYFSLVNASGFSGTYGDDGINYRNASSVQLIGIHSGDGSTQPTFQLYDLTGSYQYTIQDLPGLTGNRFAYWPDEGVSGDYPGSEIMLHNTLQPVNIGGVSATHNNIQTSSYSILDGGSYEYTLNLTQQAWYNLSAVTLAQWAISNPSAPQGYIYNLDQTSGYGCTLITNKYASGSVIDSMPLSTGSRLATVADMNNISSRPVGGIQTNGNTSTTNMGTYSGTATITSYTIGGWINVTAISSETIVFKLSFQDETNTSQVLSIIPVSGGTITSTGYYLFPEVHITVYPSSAISLQALLTGSGSVTFDCKGLIKTY